MNVPLSEIIEFMEQIAPMSSALEWDNVGLQIGDPRSSVRSILLSLDVSPSVIEEAAGMSADLIISHHPLIFRPISKIDFTTPTGYIIREMIRHGISLFVAHTNLDRSFTGTGRILANLLGLKDIRRYSNDPNDEMNMVVAGNFDHPLSIRDVTEIFKRTLGCEYVRIIGNPYQILTVAVIPGSAGSLISKLKAPFDLIVTGELSYHESLAASYQGRAIALIGHFFSEKPIMFHLKERLSERYPDISIKVSDCDGEPYRLLS